eukprot:gnl/TRDRNA2_/TRDRNA2_174119_c0_seq3.p1 gnl/TRDRNA2_/TRDRNA2_174119_c0~~gnl/TRDRNA2_/TRDRNA2_174119_c0_seq3.p1  ORF type:complete len:394 (+),score=50.88 gnl/TRDRNA2_/TRDRNA2_174119_c0_seq3:51-1232(+)
MAARFFRKSARVRFSTGCRALAFAGASTAIGAGSFGVSAAEEIQTRNRSLSNRHRICITRWSIVNPRTQEEVDVTSKNLRCNFESLLFFLKEKGYEGIEISMPDLRNPGTTGVSMFPGHLSDKEVASAVRQAVAKTGVKVIGSFLHITDGEPPGGPADATGLDYTVPDFWENLRKVLELEKSIGSEYVTFQVRLPPEMNSTGGTYRRNEEYLKLSALRIERLQKVCFSLGMNFYVETHIERISEDPEAFCKIFDYCPVYFEVNADISHYIYRNIQRGKHFDRIMDRVGHCHIRLCRVHGDLSAEPGVHVGSVHSVGEPGPDWDAQGVTWQAAQAMRPALERGLSSSAICGEAGPAFLVPDALLLDTKLVPLYRHMAAIADNDRRPRRNPFKSE